jgi:hypothetical protein
VLRRTQRRTSRGLFVSGVQTSTLRDAIVGFRPPLRTLWRNRELPYLREQGGWLRYAVVAVFVHYGYAVDRLRHVLKLGRDYR